MSPQRIVISLGGSLFIPETIDVAFLRSFKTLIQERIAAGETFIIVVGGGKLARQFQGAGRELADLSQADVDWLGIYATRLNAEFMRIIFQDQAYERIIVDPNEVIETTAPIIFGAGAEPGVSTDYDAVLMGKGANAKKIINLSNTSYVYDKDPKKNPDAKTMKSLTWAEYRALIPATWEPGLNTPFDPIASKEAQESAMEVVIMDGTKLEEVKKYLQGEPFEGTTIRP